MSIRTRLAELRDIPKTIYTNFSLFSFKVAIKLPIRVKYNVKVGKLRKGSVLIDFPINKYCIKLGYNGACYISENHSSLNIINGGKITFCGPCTIAEGFNIYVNGGEVSFGAGFYANRNLEIQSEIGINIGNSVLIGWTVSLRDTDGHAIATNGVESPEKKPIFIDDHVWVASECTLLKGTSIARDNIIGCKSLVCGSEILESNCLIAGTPAKIRKKGVSWNN